MSIGVHPSFLRGVFFLDVMLVLRRSQSSGGVRKYVEVSANRLRWVFFCTFFCTYKKAYKVTNVVLLWEESSNRLRWVEAVRGRILRFANCGVDDVAKNRVRRTEVGYF